MAPPTSLFDATTQDMEMLLAAQAHLGSKNLQVCVPCMEQHRCLELRNAHADEGFDRFTWIPTSGRQGLTV